MPPHPLSVAVVHALGVLVAEGDLPWRGALPDGDEADDARAFRNGAGYASSLPLRLSGRAGMPAAELAARLAGRLATMPQVAAAAVTGSGYLEIEPEPAALVRAALRAGRPGAEPPRSGPVLDPLLTAGPGSRRGGHVRQELHAAVAEVGADAVRFALARRSVQATPLDLAVLGRADERNPVHSVQLAHARLAAALRHADALGLRPDEGADVDPELLHGPADTGLVAALAEASAVVPRAVRLRRADLLARHLETTAEAAHRFASSGQLLPQGDEEPDAGHRARLRLAAAAVASLAHGLDLLGVTAPERM